RQGSSTIKVWDVASGKATLTLNNRNAVVSQIALSRDGKRLITSQTKTSVDAGGGTFWQLNIWELETQAQPRSLGGHFACIIALAIPADGKRLVSSSFDGVIKAWDLEAGKEISTLRGHAAMAFSLEISGDGRRLLSRGWLTTPAIEQSDTKLWDLDKGEENPILAQI